MRVPVTVRARITALAALAVLIVLVLTALVLVAQQRRLLTEALDESLATRAAELAALGTEVPEEITGLGEDDAMAQVVVGGEVVASSQNVAGLPPQAEAPDDRRQRITTVDRLPHEDGRFRVLTRRVEGPDEPRLIILGGALDDIDDSITLLTRSLIVIVPAAVAALGFLLWWLVGRTLEPVEAIRAEVAAIGGSGLHRRVPVPPGDDEVARLARTMNDMLDRLEDSAHRQHRFVADASHELRSPLARMRAELEVDLAHPEDADLAATHRSALEETVRLQRLADDLLTVARADEVSTAEPQQELVDLDDLVVRVARRLRADDRVRVDLSGVSAAQVRGDRDQLARLVANLADNAVRHARNEVVFTVTEAGEAAVLTVADDGPGVPEADRERIFERFARGDEARTASEGGVGLGLAIARDITERHGGMVAVEPAHPERADGPGARFVVRLPRAT